MVDRTATTERGWDALAQGDWKRARKLFAGAGESAEALEGLGLAAWWQDEEADARRTRTGVQALPRTRRSAS